MTSLVQAAKLAPGDSRFDRSSWVTLYIALAIFIPTMGVVIASSRMAMDGWLADRGAWGRYTNPIYLEKTTDNSDLRPGDILLAVEDVSFERLEAQAASLRPHRPPNWKLGEAIHYTVLRHGREVEATVTLVRSPLLSLYRPQVLLETPILLTFPIFFLISALVFALRPRERAAQLLFLFGFAFFNDNFITWSSVLPNVADLFSTAAYWPKIILGNMLWSILIGPLLVHLFFIFPVRKYPIRRWPRLIPLVLYGSGAVASLIYVLLGVSDRSISGVSFTTVLIVPYLVLTAASLIHSWLTVRDPVACMQVRRVAFGGLFGIVGPISLWAIAGGLSASIPFWLGLVYLLLALAFPLSLAIAILRYRLWEIQLIIRRTSVYGALTGTLATVYFASVVLLQTVFPADSQISIVLSTLATVLLFSPLRHRIQASIDRRFYRRQYDAQQTLAAFSVTVRDEVELERLTTELVRVVEETMQPTQVSLWLKQAE